MELKKHHIKLLILLAIIMLISVKYINYKIHEYKRDKECLVKECEELANQIKNDTGYSLKVKYSPYDNIFSITNNDSYNPDSIKITACLVDYINEKMLDTDFLIRQMESNYSINIIRQTGKSTSLEGPMIYVSNYGISDDKSEYAGNTAKYMLLTANYDSSAYKDIIFSSIEYLALSGERSRGIEDYTLIESFPNLKQLDLLYMTLTRENKDYLFSVLSSDINICNYKIEGAEDLSDSEEECIEYIKYIKCNFNRLEPVYVADIDLDGHPEIISFEAKKNGFNGASVYAYDDSGSYAYKGTIEIDVESEINESILYKDTEKNETFLYSIIAEPLDNEGYYMMKEYKYYSSKYGSIESENNSTYEMIPKDDKQKLMDYIEERKKSMAVYEKIGEVAAPHKITYVDVWNDSYIDIIHNINKKNPDITISVNGKEETLPWDTYSYTIEENFDWSQLQQLPNLRNIIIKTTPSLENIDLLTNLNSVKSLKIESSQWNEQYLNAISHMDSLRELYLDKCENTDMTFLNKMKNLMFISVSYENAETALQNMEKTSLKIVELHKCTIEQYEKIKTQYPQYKIIMAEETS